MDNYEEIERVFVGILHERGWQQQVKATANRDDGDGVLFRRFRSTLLDMAQIEVARVFRKESDEWIVRYPHDYDMAPGSIGALRFDQLTDELQTKIMALLLVNPPHVLPDIGRRVSDVHFWVYLT